MSEYNEYWEGENKRIEREVSELKAELGYEDWIEGQCQRLVFLYDRLAETKRLISEYTVKYTQSLLADRDYLERHALSIMVRELQADHQKMSREFDRITGVNAVTKGKGKITDEMIRRAKEYPLEKLVEVDKKGFALCVNHADNKPSMFCRNNYAYCFSCGYKGDVLDVAMKLKGLDFIGAVKELN